MVYDNLRAVVETIFSGKEHLFNRRFTVLANHYLFEQVACTPASSWEKGRAFRFNIRSFRLPTRECGVK